MKNKLTDVYGALKRLSSAAARNRRSDGADERPKPTAESRRRLITGGSALAVGFAGLYGVKARAGHFGGDTFHLNHNNTSSASTSLVRNSGTPNTFTMTLFNQDTNGSALRAEGFGSGRGVDAVCTFGNSQSVAVQGRAQNGGTGVFGIAEDQTSKKEGRPAHGVGVSGEGPDFGVQGRGGIAGVSGVSEGNGVEGSSEKEIGVYGNAFEGVGVVGSSTKGDAARFYGDVHISGELFLQGNKSAVVPFPDGTHRRLYCQESPEAWFEDFGEARLKGGRAEVALDKRFAGIVRGDCHVFLTPYGDCNGLYVHSRTKGGFVVRELTGGDTNIAFAFRVVARRRDRPADRFAEVVLPAPPPPRDFSAAERDGGGRPDTDGPGIG